MSSSEDEEHPSRTEILGAFTRMVYRRDGEVHHARLLELRHLTVVGEEPQLLLLVDGHADVFMTEADLVAGDDGAGNESFTVW